MTIRELVDQKVEKLRDIDSLSAQDIAQESIELSSLWASVNKELIDRTMWYNEKRKMMLEEYKVAAKAKIHAEASPEYRQMLEAEAYSKSIQEMIRTTKKYTAIAESAMRESKY